MFLSLQSARVRSLSLIVSAAILWGTVGVSTQTLYHLTATNPLSIGFFRLAFATPVLWAVAWISLGRKVAAIRRRDLAIMLIIGAMLALYQACFFAAIARVGVTVATLVTLCLAPVIVAALATVITRERLRWSILMALALALAGTGCVIGGRVNDLSQPYDLTGILFAVGSALGYAVVTLASRALAGRYPAPQINAVGFTMGALLLLPLAAATGFVINYPPQGWLLLGYLGVIPTALAYGLFVTGMRGTPATVASIATLVEPLTASILAAILFGEWLGPIGIIGALAMLAALLLLALNSRE